MSGPHIVARVYEEKIGARVDEVHVEAMTCTARCRLTGPYDARPHVADEIPRSDRCATGGNHGALPALQFTGSLRSALVRRQLSATSEKQCREGEDAYHAVTA